MRDVKRNEIRKVVEPIVENILRTLFFWTSDDKEFGQMLINFHIFIFWIFHTTVILVNIISIPTVLIVGILILAVILLAQHYFVGVCILSSIEKRVNGEPYPMTEPLLRFFGIPISVENVRGVTCLLITIYMISFALQLLRIWINSR